MPITKARNENVSLNEEERPDWLLHALLLSRKWRGKVWMYGATSHLHDCINRKWTIIMQFGRQAVLKFNQPNYINKSAVSHHIAGPVAEPGILGWQCVERIMRPMHPGCYCHLRPWFATHKTRKQHGYDRLVWCGKKTSMVILWQPVVGPVHHFRKSGKCSWSTYLACFLCQMN